MIDKGWSRIQPRRRRRGKRKDVFPTLFFYKRGRGWLSTFLLAGLVVLLGVHYISDIRSLHSSCHSHERLRPQTPLFRRPCARPLSTTPYLATTETSVGGI
jgi:hypothetical protein